MEKRTISLLDQLEEVTGEELRTCWYDEFDVVPAKRLSKDIMIHILAFNKQVRDEGGLVPKSKRKLATYSRQLTVGDKLTPASVRIKPGTKLLREWNGEIHNVLTLAKGFEYQGDIYTSLSPIAKQITGSHWSGPRFFGVNKQAPHGKELSHG